MKNDDENRPFDWQDRVVIWGSCIAGAVCLALIDATTLCKYCGADKTVSRSYANNGGKRRHHVAPALDSEKLQIVARMRKEGFTMRATAAVMRVASSTISNALNHKGAYQGAGI
jgi:hypothetical protein